MSTFFIFSDYELEGRVRAFARDCGRKIRMGMVCIVQTSTRNDSAVVHPKQNSLTANVITLNDSFFVNNIDVWPSTRRQILFSKPWTNVHAIRNHHKVFIASDTSGEAINSFKSHPKISWTTRYRTKTFAYTAFHISYSTTRTYQVDSRLETSCSNRTLPFFVV